MAQLRITLFGEFLVRSGDRTIGRFRTRKTASVLAYLAMSAGRAVPRDRIVDAVWPESEPDAGRHSLRTALASLRGQLEEPGAPLFVIDRHSVMLPEALVECDARQFEAHLAMARAARSEAEEAGHLKEALGLYRDELLPGFYEEWVLETQRRLELSFVEAALRLSEIPGEEASAIAALKQAQRANPFHDEVARRLVAVLVHAGDASGAQAARQVYLDAGGGPIEGMAEASGRPPIQATRKEPPARAAAPSGTTTFLAADGSGVSTFAKAALAAQAAVALPEDVRAGLDTTEGDASDPRTSRLAQALSVAASPGQVLCSERTAAFLRDTKEVRLVDLGTVRLTGSEAMRRVFQISPAGRAPRAFPPIQAERLLGGALPPTLDRFFGRSEESQWIVEALGSGARLVTLVGPGGNGKTRLALHAAQAAAPTFPGGTFFVPLANARPGDDLAGLAARALGLEPGPAAGLVGQLSAALGAAPFLLVIDNVEQVLEPATRLIQDLLAGLENLSCLVTSRIKLDRPGERLIPVSPLPLPEDESAMDESPSVQLFVDRARGVIPDFRLSDRNRKEIAQICSGLEGIPLAIELAAARIRKNTPHEILQGLQHRLDFLRSGSRAFPERHRTMRTAFDWSYEMLPEPLRRVLGRLSVFQGGWAADAATAVCECSQEDLDHLQDASFFSTQAHKSAKARFAMLEVLREYATDRTDAAEIEGARQAHMRWYCGAIADANARLFGPEEEAALAELDADLPNVRLALETAIEVDPSLALRSGRQFSRYWDVRGYFAEGLRTLEAAIDAADPDDPDRAPALSTAGVLAAYTGEDGRARALLTQAAAALKDRDQAGYAQAIKRLGNVSYQEGDYAEARALYEQAAAIALESANERELSALKHNMANVEAELGHHDVAERLYEDAAEYFSSHGAEQQAAVSLSGIATLAFRRRDYRTSGQRLRQALAIQERFGDRHGAAKSKHLLGNIAAAQGELDLAMKLYREALSLNAEIGAELTRAENLQEIAMTQLRLGNSDAALLTASESCRAYLHLSFRIEALDAFASLAIIRAERGEPVFAAKTYGFLQEFSREHRLELHDDMRDDLEEAMRKLREADPSGFDRAVDLGMRLRREKPDAASIELLSFEL